MAKRLDDDLTRKLAVQLAIAIDVFDLKNDDIHELLSII
jgi:hypothetical protein